MHKTVKRQDFLQFWHSAQVFDDSFNIWQNLKELSQPKTQTDVKKNDIS